MNSNELYNHWKKEKLCTRCGGDRGDSTTSQCIPCLEYAKNYVQFGLRVHKDQAIEWEELAQKKGFKKVTEYIRYLVRQDMLRNKATELGINEKKMAELLKLIK